MKPQGPGHPLSAWLPLLGTLLVVLLFFTYVVQSIWRINRDISMDTHWGPLSSAEEAAHNAVYPFLPLTIGVLLGECLLGTVLLLATGRWKDMPVGVMITALVQVCMIGVFMLSNAIVYGLVAGIVLLVQALWRPPMLRVLRATIGLTMLFGAALTTTEFVSSSDLLPILVSYTLIAATYCALFLVRPVWPRTATQAQVH